MLQIKKIKPLYTGVITTADKYSEDIKLGVTDIIDSTKANTLKEYQTVITVGEMVRNVKPGDLVLINPAAYEVKKYANSVKEDMVEHYKQQKDYNFNIVNINDESCLFIQERDIDFVIEEYDEVETSTIMTEKDTKSPLIIT